MKLGTLDIKKAYLGTRELTSSNAFIGDANLISGSSGPEMIDLGLPSGTLWAKYNIGVDPSSLSTKNDWYGSYYAWGELAEKSKYDWDTYKFGRINSINKYKGTDNKTELDSEDDIATITYGEPYHMPSRSQIAELMNTDNVTNSWVNDYHGVSGLNGRLFTSIKNNNSLFIPANGNIRVSSLMSDGSLCYLWSRSVSTSDIRQSGFFYSYNIESQLWNIYRCYGYAARAVLD